MIVYDNKSYLRLVFAFTGTVIPRMLPRILFFMIWAGGISSLYAFGILDKGVKVDMVVFTIVGLAMGLLLVFRTNSSYDRYWEGRKLWGGCVNHSRSFSFLLNTVIPSSDKGLRSFMAEHLAAFHHALKEHLRDGVKEEHFKGLRIGNAEAYLEEKHIPNALMRDLHLKLSETGKNYAIPVAQTQMLLTHLSELTNNMGGMERIRNTPVPFAYASHLTFFMFLYFMALPFGLYHSLQWLAIPALGIIVLVMDGINEIGIEIEDPFGDDPNDLPTDKICATITDNVRTILGE